MTGYDGYYPQYQFYQGPRPGRQFDPKFLNDALIQLLFKSQTQGQILDAFSPGGTGGSGAPSGGQGGMSYLEQLLAASAAQQGAQGPSAAQAAGPAAMQAMLEEPRKRRITVDGGGMIDRGGYGGLGMSGY